MFLAVESLPLLLSRLWTFGYTVVGPRIDQDAIVYGEISSIDELPRGWTDEQAPGYYRIRRTAKRRFFDYAVGPHSWKKYLHPPNQLLSRATETEDGWVFATESQEPKKLAFLGARACELAAIHKMDRVFLDGAYVDTGYRQRRDSTFIIAVNCAVASANCFCSSMNTGPKCDAGFDIALTELDDGMVVEVASDRGKAVVDGLNLPQATEAQLDAAKAVCDATTAKITKSLDTKHLRDRLVSNPEHSRWKDVAERCLSCTNCTMVCPTCFCTHVAEAPDLSNAAVERRRCWDSCFNPDFCVMNGCPVRGDTLSRYRQWLTHKLATWHDQFGESGCVGCGRCITWCPVGIDLTVEAKAISSESS